MLQVQSIPPLRRDDEEARVGHQDKVLDDQQDGIDEDEEGNEFPIEIEDQENLVYLLNLLLNAEHKINREEVKDYRSALKLELY